MILFVLIVPSFCLLHSFSPPVTSPESFEKNPALSDHSIALERYLAFWLPRNPFSPLYIIHLAKPVSVRIVSTPTKSFFLLTLFPYAFFFPFPLLPLFLSYFDTPLSQVTETVSTYSLMSQKPLWALPCSP